MRDLLQKATVVQFIQDIIMKESHENGAQALAFAQSECNISKLKS